MRLAGVQVPLWARPFPWSASRRPAKLAHLVTEWSRRNRPSRAARGRDRRSGSISLEARRRRRSVKVLILKALGHPDKEGTYGRLGDVVQQGAVELTSELPERGYVGSKEGDTAVVRVSREEFHVAIEHRKERRQPTRLPRYGHDHRDPTVARRTECHPNFTRHSPARPRRSHAEVKRFAVLFGCARERREPSSVTDKALPTASNGRETSTESSRKKRIAQPPFPMRAA